MVIGLTGRSGSGKSTVASVFEKNGAVIIDADQIYRILCKSSMDMKRELCKRFGDILDENCEVNRRKLATLVYKDEAALSDLNRITHRYVMHEINNRLIGLQSSGAKCAVIDAPLLFEASADKLCDLTVGIIASKPDMVNRVLLRDGITYDEASMRLNNQPDNLFYVKNCNMVLENNGSLKDLSIDATGLFEKIMQTRINSDVT
ncbi:MAG: dephospho-CoA kinase [Clostridiales bacterium]|nr:dephospho-CoA kinase [Clostridiales bacterium]